MIGKRFSSDDEVLGRLRRKFNSGVFQHGPDGPAILENDWNNIIIEEKTDDYSIEADDFGKMFAMNAAGDKKFTLPVIVAINLGLPIIFMKRGAGKVTIQAGGADKINDSTAGGTLYNDLAEETFAVVTLRVYAVATWIIESFTGSGWRTS